MKSGGSLLCLMACDLTSTDNRQKEGANRGAEPELIKQQKTGRPGLDRHASHLSGLWFQRGLLVSALKGRRTSRNDGWSDELSLIGALWRGVKGQKRLTNGAVHCM